MNITKTVTFIMEVPGQDFQEYTAEVEMDVWEESIDGSSAGMETYSEIVKVTVYDENKQKVEETPEMGVLIDKELAHVDLTDEINDELIDEAEERMNSREDM